MSTETHAISKVTENLTLTDYAADTLEAYKTIDGGDSVFIELSVSVSGTDDYYHMVELTKDQAIELMAWLSEVTK